MKKTCPAILLSLLLALTVARVPFAACAEDSEPVVLTCWGTLDSIQIQVMTTWNDNAAIQAATKATGVQLEWQLPPQGQVQEQFNLMVTSDTLPDVIMYNVDSYYPGGASAALRDALILPLNDYAAAMPNYMNFLAAYPEIDRMVKTDEGQYYCIRGATTRSKTPDAYDGIYERNLEYECYMGLAINEEWLKELSIERPVTIADWESMLTRFKEEKGSAAPLTITSGHLFNNNAFLSAYGTAHYLYTDPDGTVHFGPAEAGYREYLTLMNDWYNKGLLDKDFAALDDNAMMAKIINGESGAYGAYGSRIGIVYRDTRESNPNVYPVAVANPVLKEGDKLLYAARSLPLGGMVCVSTTCKDVEAALSVWDFFWSQEGAMYANWGEAGVSYELDGSGYPRFTDLLNNNPDGFDSNTICQRYMLKGGPTPIAMEYVAAIQMAYGTPEAYGAPVVWGTANGEMGYMMPVSLTGDESSAYATAYNDIRTYTDEMRTKFIMGVEPLENYDAFVEALKAMRLQDVLDIQQAALDRYNAR